MHLMVLQQHERSQTNLSLLHTLRHYRPIPYHQDIAGIDGMFRHQCVLRQHHPQIIQHGLNLLVRLYRERLLSMQNPLILHR